MLIGVRLRTGNIAFHRLPKGSVLAERYPFMPEHRTRAVFFIKDEGVGYDPATVRAITPDKTIYTYYPSGRITRRYDNGVFYSINADGSARKSLPDGSFYDVKSDGSIKKYVPDIATCYQIVEKVSGHPISRRPLPRSKGPPAIIRGRALKAGFQL